MTALEELLTASDQVPIDCIGMNGRMCGHCARCTLDSAASRVRAEMVEGEMTVAELMSSYNAAALDIENEIDAHCFGLRSVEAAVRRRILGGE